MIISDRAPYAIRVGRLLKELIPNPFHACVMPSTT